jgi:hypothetical protein
MIRLSVLLLWLAVAPSYSATTIEVIPGSGNHIHYENKTTAAGSWKPDDLIVTSDIPVTILRYNDHDYLDGGQPVESGDVYIVVTSNCSISDADFTPTVTFGVDEQHDTASISINVDPPSSSSQELEMASFLNPSSFFAFFSYTSYFCRYYNNDYGYDTTDNDTMETDNTENEPIGNPFEVLLAIGSGNTNFRPIQLTFAALAAMAGLFVIGGNGRQPQGFSFLGIVVAALAVTMIVVHGSIGNDESLSYGKGQEQDRRELVATCTMNVELLLDGCVRSLQVTAPAVRALDVVLTDQSSSDNPYDECTTDHKARLTFPVTSGSEAPLDDNSTATVPPLSDDVCYRAIEGRPFVDMSGKHIQAFANIGGDEEVCWSAGASYESKLAITEVASASQDLGSEWTTRALGEHASISSFAAFTIALMSNNAPPGLVQDALLAALDEVRHATTAFEIASLLLGNVVEPGPLPASSHKFGTNMTALALAAAREGCLDETLSALVAAYDVDEEADKYEGVNDDVVVLVKDKLHTIALEEGRHSSLAWRTVHWVCKVDKHACASVQQEVFTTDKLDAAFERRFSGTASNIKLQSEWERLYKTLVPFVTTKAIVLSVQQDANDKCSEVSSASGSEKDGKSLTESLVENIIRGVVCSSDSVDASETNLVGSVA